MIKNDAWINSRAVEGMIKPYVDRLVRVNDDRRRVISYGLSSFGYDLRLSATDFRVIRHNVVGTLIDPKQFDETLLEPLKLQSDDSGKFFVMPGYSYGLGVAIERLSLPNNITAQCIGKSTYARSGIIANLTPVEAGWRGYLTLEFHNASATDVRIYANEGVAQLQFFEGEYCAISYEDRKGKYQDQPQRVVTSRV